MKGKSIRKKLLYSFVFAIILVGLVELCANLKIIAFANNPNVNLSNKNVILSGFKCNKKGFALKKNKGSLKWELDGEYVDKLSFEYENGGFLDAKIEMGVNNSLGKEEVVSIEDNNPILIKRSTVNIDKKVNWISIVISGEQDNSGLIIKNVKIKNVVNINKYRMVATWLIGLLCSFFYWERRLIKENIEWGFVAISLVLGIIFALSLPTNKVGWDEEAHFKMAYQMSVFPGGDTLPEAIASQFTTDTFYNYPYNQPQSLEEKKELNAVENLIYANGKRDTYVEGKLCGVYTPGLILQALAIKITRNLKMPFNIIFLSGRIVELLLYSFVMFWAIKIIPFGKRTLTFISLMPTSIFLAVTYTYDTVVFSFISLGIALIIKEWMNEYANSKNLILACFFLTIGCLPKAVYAPILLLIMFIPKKKFDKKSTMNVIKGIYGLALLLLLLSFVAPQLLNPGASSDIRVAAADSGKQMALVLKKPIAYIWVVLQNVLRTLPDYLFGLDAYRLIGHIGESSFVYLVPIVSVFCIATDYSDEYMKKIAVKQRIELLVILGIIIGLIWSALYLSFNVVGTSRIEGVQGRYYRPLLWLIYMTVSNKYIKVQFSDSRYNQLILILGFLITGTTVFNVFEMFCF